jgi:hypothetical protein
VVLPESLALINTSVLASSKRRIQVGLENVVKNNSKVYLGNELSIMG